MTNGDVYHGVNMREMFDALTKCVKQKWRASTPQQKDAIVARAALKVIEALHEGTFNHISTPTANALIYLNRAQSSFLQKERKAQRIKTRVITIQQVIPAQTTPIEGDGSVAWAVEYLSEVIAKAELAGNRSRLAAATYYRNSLCNALEEDATMQDFANTYGISRQIVWSASKTLRQELLDAHALHFDYRPTSISR